MVSTLLVFKALVALRTYDVNDVTNALCKIEASETLCSSYLVKSDYGKLNILGFESPQSVKLSPPTYRTSVNLWEKPGGALKRAENQALIACLDHLNKFYFPARDILVDVTELDANHFLITMLLYPKGSNIWSVTVNRSGKIRNVHCSRGPEYQISSLR